MHGHPGQARDLLRVRERGLGERAIAAGARRIEVTSFVNPKRVPQMADAEQVCAELPDRSDVSFIGLVMKGFTPMANSPTYRALSSVSRISLI